MDDYLPIHNWFDATKAHYADVRHRALRHHSWGIFQAEEVFGETIVLSTGRVVPVRAIGEQHVQDDIGFIPTVEQWLTHIQVQPWMKRRIKLLGGSLMELCGDPE